MCAHWRAAAAAAATKNVTVTSSFPVPYSRGNPELNNFTIVFRSERACGGCCALKRPCLRSETVYILNGTVTIYDETHNLVRFIAVK